MEKTIYTRSWLSGVAKDFSGEMFRSALFALLLLIGFVFLYGLLIVIDSTEDAKIWEYIGGGVIGFAVLVVCCWIAIFFVADDHRWGIREPLLPRIWDDQDERWITSTVSFAHYLEERGSHIESALVQYDDPRTVAHRMIDKIDDRTLQMYLSILSAMQMERERVKVESIEVKSRTLEGKTQQG
jgi:hypothetical protein